MPIISNVRRKQAKKYSILTVCGLLTGICLFLFVSRDVGLLTAIVSSAIPSTINLIDD